MNNLWKIYEKEPLEFINSLIHVPSMQRLKDIGMNCGVEYTAFDFFLNIVPYSRYQHSIGVALIVYHFSHDLRQTVAGLLHDIANSCLCTYDRFLSPRSFKTRINRIRYEKGN